MYPGIVETVLALVEGLKPSTPSLNDFREKLAGHSRQPANSLDQLVPYTFVLDDIVETIVPIARTYNSRANINILVPARQTNGCRTVWFEIHYTRIYKE